MTPPGTLPDELILGLSGHLNEIVPAADQVRQRCEVEEILRRLRHQPGLVLADEVGMGKTFVALAVAHAVATHDRRGPVVVMAPRNLLPKWEQDLRTFCELYLRDRIPRRVGAAEPDELADVTSLRYAVADNGNTFLQFMDDPPRTRAHIVLVPHGAMASRSTDKWISLFLIAEALRQFARGRARRLIQVRQVIHRDIATLLSMRGEERAHRDGARIWERLLRIATEQWRGVFNDGVNGRDRQLPDDPVPKAVARALRKVDLRPLAEALAAMPIRARGGLGRVEERVAAVRPSLADVGRSLWREVLAKARWQSPLLVLDEAHHLKNPTTRLARQLQSDESREDLAAGDSAMANAFSRMLFLTATPFQLGHAELVRVLERLGDVRWDEATCGPRADFDARLRTLQESLDASQRKSLALERAWVAASGGDPDLHAPGGADAWWSRVRSTPIDRLTIHERSFREAYDAALKSREGVNSLLRRWIVRHNKGGTWPGTPINRRERIEGAGIISGRPPTGDGIDIPAGQLLPFFLAARAAATPHDDLLGEAMCSSYEAFRKTRADRRAEKDEAGPQEPATDILHSEWYLAEFDRALEEATGSIHPKLAATVRRAVDLWEANEKVVVFAFYRHTCRALRLEIGNEIRRRLEARVRTRLHDAADHGDGNFEKLFERIHDRFFDDLKSPGRRALDAELDGIMTAHRMSLDRAGVPDDERESMVVVMRRFLRVSSTLARCFPLEADLSREPPEEIVRRLLDQADASGMSWRAKFDGFVDFLAARCSGEQRREYLAAAETIDTRAARVSADGGESDDDAEDARVIAAVKACTGDTRQATRVRLMQAFNTPFLPDILVCSEVMGEGVDLQRYCRHVIHHDLAWSPSTIEQRTGRIDRLGCKAAGRQSIVAYLPYLSGAADERQFRVMRDREQWFQVVMGQDVVDRLITADSVERMPPLPREIVESLAFRLTVHE